MTVFTKAIPKKPATSKEVLGTDVAALRKIDLECREIEARIAREDAKAVVEKEKAAVEMAKALAEINGVNATVRLNAVAVEKLEREAEEAACDWRYQHKYMFAESTTAAGVTRAMDRINVWDQLDPTCDIEISFNSPSDGDVIAVMSFYDYIRAMSRKGHKITTVCTGMAASMAGILLQAGDVRVSTKESLILIHEITFNANGKIGEVEDTWLMAQKLTEHVTKIFIERAGGLLSEETLRTNWARKDWWLDAEEALALGIIDEIR